ncbi:MAG: molecular chaperone [Nitrospira sp.]|nr:molecular chaperone [Nitrospira sp.]
MKRFSAWNHKVLVAFLILTILFLLRGSANPITFDINPVRIFFDAKVTTEKLNVRNSGDRDFSLQLRVYKWSQDAHGEDIYEETTDIVIFPKIVTIKKGEEKIIRIGTKPILFGINIAISKIES